MKKHPKYAQMQQIVEHFKKKGWVYGTTYGEITMFAETEAGSEAPSIHYFNLEAPIPYDLEALEAQLKVKIPDEMTAF